MEGDAGRGFARLLSRLDDATRDRYCGDALRDALSTVLAEFQQCQQAMDHARQVDDATRSLIANAAHRVHVDSPATKRLLVELQGLEAEMVKTLEALTAVSDDRLAAVRPEKGDSRRVDEVKIEVTTAETTHTEQTTLVATLKTVLVDQRGDTWVSAALETARSLVKGLSQRESSTATEFTTDERQLFEALKLLRKAVLKHAATNTEDVIAFRKLLKRLLKKRPVFKAFVGRTEEMLAEKGAKAAKKSVEEKPDITTPPAKAKKRKLPEASETPSKSKTSADTSAIADIRSKARLCSTKASSLGDVFSLSAFDASLKLLIEVVNGLTHQFTTADTTLVSSTLFLLVDAAAKIKVLDKRLDRLVCLESLLSVLVTKERLQWDRLILKALQDKLTKCRGALETARRQITAPMTSKPAPQTPAAKKKKKEKVAPSHTRFE